MMEPNIVNNRFHSTQHHITRNTLHFRSFNKHRHRPILSVILRQETKVLIVRIGRRMTKVVFGVELGLLCSGLGLGSRLG